MEEGEDKGSSVRYHYLKTPKFIEGNVPKGYKIGFDVSVFNTMAHHYTQSPSGWRSYHLVREDKKLVLASVHFCIKKRIAYSPLSAPFGAYEFSKSLPVADLFDFMQKCELSLKKSASRIVFKLAPAAYDQQAHDIQSVLLTNQNFRITNAELGACISIDSLDFDMKIDNWERRRLKQAKKEALICRPLLKKDLPHVYDFISSCREEKGHELSMTSTQLQKTVDAMVKSFQLFGVFRQRKLIAASISIRVTDKILYNFYSAHVQAEDAVSPMVYLISEMYKWGRANSISLLDLGTSALGGIPNFSLIDFKLRLGAAPTMKLFFEKDLK